MKHIVQYLFNALRNGELSENDALLDVNDETSFLYYDADGLRLYRVSVEEVVFP